MVKFTRAIIVFFLALLSGINPVNAQCPIAEYSITQPVCPQQLLSITNSSTGASTYEWDFCAGDFETTQFSQWDTATTVVTASVAVAVIDGANHYGFLGGRSNDNLLRLDYGNSFSNTPSIVDLGNPLNSFASPSGLVFHKEGGIWYAIEISIFSFTATLFTWGNGLDNPPTAAPPISITGLNSPRSIALTVENGNVIAAIMNNADDKLFICDFGPSITNANPTVNSYPLGIANAWGVSIAHECNTTCVFVTSYSGTVMRVDFTNTLQNAPTSINTLNITSSLSSGVSVINDNGKWLAIVSAYSTGIVSVIDIGDSLTNMNPTLLTTYTLTGAPDLNGLTTLKENSDWYISIAEDVGSKFVSITPLNPCNASPPISTDPAPSNIIYNSDGTYNISLQASDVNGNVNYVADSVVVSPAAVVNFSFENLCQGDVVQFYDSSTLSSGTITNRHWDFGDSDTSNAVNPTHQYSGINSYTVTLTLTASSGCITSLSQTVNITARPVANFGLPVGCSDLLMNFTDSSTISSGSITNWLWTFGNGDSLTDQNPVYAFPDGGNFDITLQVTSDAGCTDDTTYNLSINPSPDAGFIIDNTCVGQSVVFTDTTVSQSPVASYLWDFGDAGSSNIASPTHTYSTGVPATYNVVFTVVAQNNCSDQVALPVHISYQPTADFSFPPIICENNTVAFIDSSFGTGDTISYWAWDFGDGFTDSVENPLHVFMIPDSLSSDTFQVTLIAYTPSSCPSAPLTQDVIVSAGANVNIGYNEVCLGDSNYFYDNSSGTIISRMWRFDGIDSSSLMNPVYLFTTPGIHEVTLTLTTDLGCISIDTITLRVHDNPNAAFSYINACTDYPTIFTNNTTVDSLAYINIYLWNFGDPGDTANTSGLENPIHIYDSSVVGLHFVTLFVQDNFGCTDSVLQMLDVNFSVRPRFGYDPTCLGDIMTFTNLSDNKNLDSTWTWNFGDQQTNNIENPAHYYVYAGTYTVTLTALSVDGCISSASSDVVVNDIPVADFASLPACIHNPFTFTDLSTVSNGSIDKWTWTFDTLGTDSSQNPVFTFDTTGVYSVSLKVSAVGCVDSVSKNITVHPLPVPNFSYSPQYGNPPLDVAFTNLTDISSTYTWDFGDGSQGSSSAAPHHVYQDTGRFVIELIATSTFGCVDSISKGIYVIQPILDAAVTNVSATLVNGQLSIQANIANLGTVDIDSVIMQAQLPDGTVIQETYHQLLPNGSNGIQSYNFVASFNTSSTSNVSFYCVSVIKPNGRDDDVESNNEKCSSLTNEFSIMEPYPNPFTDMLQLKVILPYDDYLTVELYNSIGQKITTLFDGMGKTGLNAIEEDFSSLNDAVYLLRFSFRDKDLVRRVIKQTKKK